jgi:hypothetical protein
MKTLRISVQAIAGSYAVFSKAYDGDRPKYPNEKGSMVTATSIGQARELQADIANRHNRSMALTTSRHKRKAVIIKDFFE